ncbi:MAG TPA: protein kinase [Vicinamibacteria bacterium]|nr:protein kinase [Vicinamibacteria bacterium]
MIGKTLAHYTITSELGKGGMGEVYRATDTKLGREVAIKVLPAALAADRERLARFEREAKLLASLNHPNIAHVYGFESATLEDGSSVHFLAMELVEGEDLSERLKRGPIPIDEALAIAKQIAEALEEAHEKGIVHRDLKPANVKLTPDGKVKVLDFGLAKVFTAESAPSGSTDLSQSPTLAQTGTQAGVILGTAAYMSPEQARGKPVDKRADIWAFGVVLVEMLTGQRLFTGETVSDVLAGVLTREPDWTSLPQAVGPELRLALRRCLAKDPRSRWRSAGDLAQVLQDSATATSPVAEARGRDAIPWKWVALLALAAVAALALLWIRDRSKPRAPSSPVLSYRSLTQAAGMEVEPSLSPDGRLVAYSSNTDGDWDIYVARVAGGKPINVTADSSADDYQPAFSPDGERIAFRSERDGGGVFVMSATGESLRRAAAFGFNPSWAPDGTRLVLASESIRISTGRATLSQLSVVDVVSGAVTEIGGDDAVQPAWSPNGLRIAFWGAWPIGSGNFDLWTIAPDGSDKKRVTNDRFSDWSPVWSPDGRFLWFTSDRGGSENVWRVALDESGKTLGVPQPMSLPSGDADQVSFAAGGDGFAFTALDRRSNLERVAFDSDREQVTGSPVALTRGTRFFLNMAPSPDGQWIALSDRSEGKVSLVSRDGASTNVLTDADARQVCWRPDGSEIAFVSRRSGLVQIWSIRPDGSALKQLTDATKGVALPVWSPDGRRLVGGWDEPSYFDAESGPPMRLLNVLPQIPNAGGVFWPDAWSPNGRELAGVLTLDKGGFAPGISVLSIAEGTYRNIAPDLTHHGSPAVAWLQDSRRLLYSSREAGIYLVDTETGQVRLLLRPPAGSFYSRAQAGSGDREIFFLRGEQEADVWMASFAPEGR